MCARCHVVSHETSDYACPVLGPSRPDLHPSPYPLFECQVCHREGLGLDDMRHLHGNGLGICDRCMRVDGPVQPRLELGGE